MNQHPPLHHQVCKITVMDTTDPDIRFDENGVCNYVAEFEAFSQAQPDSKERQRRLNALINSIKSQGQGQQYDCLLGVSGGVDSSYLAYLAHEWGLRPLIVHFDNGWNSELAVKNIEEMVTRLGFDLETFVVDWDAFRELQAAYFRASVVDIEIPTDHLIFAALNQIAAKRNIRVLLSGHNNATEWLLPKPWYYSKFDLRNMVDINRQYGRGSLAKLPKLGVWQQFYYYHFKRIRMVQPLQLIDFNKARAKRFLIDEMGWRDYGGKHHESIFTRFYQGYMLPNKFGIDKRKAHLSNLILTGQITRHEALRELQMPPYDEDQQLEDKRYVAKKLGFSEEEFDQIMVEPVRDHREFRTDEKDRELYFKIARAYGRVRAGLQIKKRPYHFC
uniref:N-acetyl sugar amidotransferase n=1 Tax=Pararhizobium sp. IMCC3301 TaxID=3067904 RepID=UPI002740FC13|nr:N-acetyl sugar amidotransferase [Pararhizobium sp. IMCC3301]